MPSELEGLDPHEPFDLPAHEATDPSHLGTLCDREISDQLDPVDATDPFRIVTRIELDGRDGLGRALDISDRGDVDRHGSPQKSKKGWRTPVSA